MDIEYMENKKGKISTLPFRIMMNNKVFTSHCPFNLLFSQHVVRVKQWFLFHLFGDAV